MAGIQIPALGTKLRLLIDYGHFGGWESLGKAFDRSAATLKWWRHGDAVRPPDTLPANQFESLIEIVGACVGDRSREEIKHLIFAPASEFEARLQMQSATSLAALINKEAIPASTKLYLKPPVHGGLIETDRKAPIPEPELKVKRGRWFRLEIVRRNQFGTVIAFQHAGQHWGAVPLHVDLKSQIILLPGLTEGGGVAHMVEREQIGVHRFVVMQTREAPKDIRAYMDNQIAFELAALSRLSSFFLAQPADKRAVLVVTIEITK